MGARYCALVHHLHLPATTAASLACASMHMSTAYNDLLHRRRHAAMSVPHALLKQVIRFYPRRDDVFQGFNLLHKLLRRAVAAGAGCRPLCSCGPRRSGRGDHR